jgi:hypothetical protein
MVITSRVQPDSRRCHGRSEIKLFLKGELPEIPLPLIPTPTSHITSFYNIALLYYLLSSVVYIYDVKFILSVVEFVYPVQHNCYCYNVQC